MRDDEGLNPIVVTLAISLVVHGMVGALDVPIPPMRGDRWRHDEVATFDLEIEQEFVALEPEPELVPDPVEPEPVDPDPVDPEPVEPELAAVEPRQREEIEPEPIEPEPSEPEPTDPEPSDAEPSDPDLSELGAAGNGAAGDPRLGDPRLSAGGSTMAPFDFSPLAVARAGANPDFRIGTGPSRRGGGTTSMGLGRPDDPSRGTQALQAQLNMRLQEATRASHISRRDPPELQRTRDGGYRWSGPTIAAVIRPDGRVIFSDRGGIEFDRNSLFGGQGASFNFDITTAAEQARGNDPHSAEREWFLEQTEDVRDQLAREAMERTQRTGLRRIRGRLEEIWGGRQSASQRRRALFELWDELSEDEIGNRARSTVERFVRERIPRNSPIAFSGEELSRLNRGRVSESRFDPYRVPEPEEEPREEDSADEDDPAGDGPSAPE